MSNVYVWSDTHAECVFDVISEEQSYATLRMFGCTILNIHCNMYIERSVYSMQTFEWAKNP